MVSAIAIDRQRRQQVRVRQHRCDSREMRHPAGNRAFQTGGGGRDIDRTGQAVADPNHQMRPSRPGPLAPFGEGRMTFPPKASPSERAHRLAGDAVGQAQFGGHDRDVDLAFGDIEQGRLARRGPFGGHAGRFGPQPRQQMREHGEHEIRRGDPEYALRIRGIEHVPRRQHALDSPQHRPRLFDQVERKGGRLHPHAGLDQQGIAELAAQPRQRMADRRLRPPQPLRGPGDAALGHQNFEHDQAG